MIKTHYLKAVTAGADGVAVGTAESTQLVVGEVVGVYVKYTTQPATVDVTLKSKGDAAPSYNLLAVSNLNTNGYFAPRAKPVDNANAAITNAHDRFAVADKVQLDVAQGNVGVVECWLLVQE